MSLTFERSHQVTLSVLGCIKSSHWAVDPSFLCPLTKAFETKLVINLTEDNNTVKSFPKY